VKASAGVQRAAVSELHPNSAVVLVFIHQTTTKRQTGGGLDHQQRAGDADKGRRVLADIEIRA